jgi:hypothetical protein
MDELALFGFIANWGGPYNPYKRVIPRVDFYDRIEPQLARIQVWLKPSLATYTPSIGNPILAMTFGS